MLIKKVKDLPVDGKLVLFRVRGELSGGKTSDINFNQLRNVLQQNGAIYANINRYALSSKEYKAIRVEGRDIHEVEERLLRENIEAIKVADPGLRGEKGIQVAVDLLGVLRHEKKNREKKKEYDNRMVNQAIENLSLSETMK